MNFALYYPPFHLDKEKPGTTGPRWMEWINGFDLMLNNCCVAEVSTACVATTRKPISMGMWMRMSH